MGNLQTILAEYADGLANGTVTADDLRIKYNIAPESELDHLLHLATHLEQVLVSVAPSEAFVAELREQLIGGKINPVLMRLRHLTALQVAAGIGAGLGGVTVVTVAAGLLWYNSRHRRTIAEQPTAS